MYNKALKCWESQPCEETLLLWCREPFNRDNPEAMFLLADHLLGQAEKGKETADAVYMMERAAKADNPQAALAMGQMFQYGWSVHRSWKKARQWYERAAELGSGEAAALLGELEKARRRRTLTVAVTCCLAALICLGGAFLFSRLSGPQGVLVHKDTELITPATVEEVNEALNDLIKEYDDELVISGQRSSNRLLLQFEGEGLDLSKFPAATVVADEENFVIIQFDSEEEAQRCLEALRQDPSVLFVDMDEYVSVSDADMFQPDLSSGGIPYDSPYTGKTYKTWGAEFLGLDRMAAWLYNQQTEPVVVAVLDTGTEPCDETRDRILPGADFVDGDPNGQGDGDGHGTHVAGTILDCTQGLDVTVLPVRVLGDDGSGTSSQIALGIRYAIDNKVDVINMSLGGSCHSSDPNESCGNPRDAYIRQAVEQGIVVVVAAGNGDKYGNPEDTAINCPAHIGECIVVAACDDRGDLGYFSNYGDAVDVCAPGVDVNSYWPGGETNTISGTSMATPHVAALAAMMKTYLPDKTPAQIEKYITEYCVDMGNRDYYGAGVPWAGYLSGG